MVTVSKRKNKIKNREELTGCGFQDKLHSNFFFLISCTKNMTNEWFITIMSES